MVDEELMNEPLWGEKNDTNPEFPSSWSRDVLNNHEDGVILNSIKPILFKNYFYGEGKSDSSIRGERSSIVVDDVIKRTCKLLKHKDDLKEAAEKGKLQLDVFNMDQLDLNISKCGRKNDSSIQLYKHETSDFMQGIFTKPPAEITYESTVNVLRSCVSSILAFYGFSSTTMIPLQLLTEVAEDYIRKMSRLLQINAEKEMLEGESGFSDAVDRTCHEMGIGSVRKLAQYYKEETLPFSRRRIKECKEELAVYEETIKKLRDEKRQTSELSYVEMDEDGLVIPELHLTSISGSDMSSKPFEAGLQMLQTLERQQLMNLDLSSQPSCSSTSIMVDLSCVKSEFEDVKPAKRRRNRVVGSFASSSRGRGGEGNSQEDSIFSLEKQII